MANYVKSTNFTSKDTLPTGDPLKVVKGTELDVEFGAIATAITSKADAASPTFTGTPAAPTASPGTNTTQIATTAFVTSAIGALGTISAQDADDVAITGGSITGITDLAVADGGTGASSFTANSVLLGNGTSSFQTVAPGTSGNVLTSNGTTWVSGTVDDSLEDAFTRSGEQDLSETGYQKLPGGLIMQWGRSTVNQTVTFPIEFPNACFCVVAAAGSNFEEYTASITTSSFFFGTNGNTTISSWFAVGH